MIELDTKQNFKRDKDLTIEEVKACKEYNNLSDLQAQHLIEVLKIYTQIIYEYFQKKSEEEKSKKDKIIHLHSINIKNKAA